MKKLNSKKVSDSKIDYCPKEIFPQDLNPHDTAFGGKVMAEADNIAGIVAQRHSRKVCVTLLVDSIRFLAPARQGETLIFKASLNRAWNTSMEIGVKVMAENFLKNESRHVMSAYFTFVALNKKERSTKVPPIQPETDEEKRRFDEAQKRREMRLKNEKIKAASTAAFFTGHKLPRTKAQRLNCIGLMLHVTVSPAAYKNFCSRLFVKAWCGVNFRNKIFFTCRFENLDENYIPGVQPRQSFLWPIKTQIAERPTKI